MRLITCFVLQLSAAAAVLPSPARSTEPLPAAMVIERFQQDLLAIMKEAEALGFEDRYARFETVVRESHDLPAIAALAVGRKWKGLDDTQKRALLDAFGQLSIATYASRFDGYSGERFEIRDSTEDDKGRMLVSTRLLRPEDDPVQLDYVLHMRGGRWQIVNIIAEGVSDLALKRSQYG